MYFALAHSVNGKQSLTLILVYCTLYQTTISSTQYQFKVKFSGQTKK